MALNVKGESRREPLALRSQELCSLGKRLKSAHLSLILAQAQWGMSGAGYGRQRKRGTPLLFRQPEKAVRRDAWCWRNPTEGARRPAMRAGVQRAVGLVAQSCPTLCDPWTVARQAPLSVAFSRHESQGGSPFPSPGDLPDPEIEPTSPALARKVVLLYPFSLCILTTPP